MQNGLISDTYDTVFLSRGKVDPHVCNYTYCTCDHGSTAVF